MEGVCRRIISIGSDFLFNPFKVHDIRKRVRWFDKSVYIIKPIHLKFPKKKKKMYEQNKLSASLPAHDIQPRQSEDIGTVLTHAHNFLVDLTIAHDASTGAIYETS